jgi:hypothetical protein
MGWIKRNLLFVVVAVMALGALGGAGFFIYRSYSANAEKAQNLNDIYAKLAQLSGEQPQPGTNNTQLAKEQEQQLRDWIRRAAGRFGTIPCIPTGELTSKTFGAALSATIYQLTQEGKENSVTLPPQCCFSFQVQNGLLNISSGLGPLAQQLGEVKAISEVFFAAQVNNLDSIQRVRVSEDDVAKGLEADYTEKTPITNELAIITPYVVTFRSFTPELARVICGFASSTNPFIIKSISVQPANGTSVTETSGQEVSAPNLGYGRRGRVGRYAPGYGPAPAPGYGPAPAPGYGPAGNGYGAPTQPGYAPNPGEPGSANRAAPGKGGLQTVIREQLLRVTMEVDVVRLALKS